MKPVRNTPFSQSGIGPRPVVSCDPHAWSRIRQAVDGYAGAIVRVIGESYGKETVQRAWNEFTGGGHGPFLGDDPNTELFFSWLFHRWSPGSAQTHEIHDDRCYGVPPTRAYLSRSASGLLPLQRRYLEACLSARLSFYEILDCVPHIGFKARDVLEGGEVDVTEGAASTSLRNGDIVFAHLVPIDGIVMLEAVSPYSFPRTIKTGLSGLQRLDKLHGNADLLLRRLYFRFLESHCRPLLPEVRNTDGDVIDTRTLYFDIPSAQVAYDALSPLAMGCLIERATSAGSGELRRATIPWLGPTDPRAAGLESSLLGYIHIRGRKLLVEVNSARRAETFRRLIANTPAAMARFRGVRRHLRAAAPRSAARAEKSSPTRH